MSHVTAAARGALLGSGGATKPAKAHGRAREAWNGGTALIAAGCATMAMSVVLFLADGGLARFATLGGALVAVGVLAGLLATNALLLMLVLAARVPLIDSALGQPRATSLHSRLGDQVVYGLGCHAVFLLLGYMVLDNASLVAEWAYLWPQSDFVLAVVGMGLLLLVVLSSVVAARRRLPYEVWHGIHLTSYAAVGLAIPHMFSMSGLLGEGSWQRTYWIAILVVTGVALLVFRFLTPLVISLRHKLRVVSVQPAGPDACNIELSGRRLDRLGARSGQYLHWRFLGKGLWWHQHPFSLSTAPGPDKLRITVRSRGGGSAALASVLPGTRVFVEGPYGSFTDRARTSKTIALVGAGIGIAPIRALLEDATFAHGCATVILRASRPEELYLLDEIERLCHRRGASLIVLTGHRAEGCWVPADRADLTLSELVSGLADADLYVCGPSGFTALVTAEAVASGVPARRIHVEDFNW